MVETNEDIPQLSAETFAILKEFYKEQEEKESKVALANSKDIVEFSEDWQLSQFWYDDNTIDTLVKIALKTVEANGKIALISCPTLYNKMKKEALSTTEINVFEYDQRFASFGTDFILYDYKFPLEVPSHKNKYYDLVIADPPFLSEECLTKAAVTIKFLSKDKVILCTGAIMSDLAKRLLDLDKATFEPKHKNNLANEFWCYSNYNINVLT